MGYIGCVSYLFIVTLLFATHKYSYCQSKEEVIEHIDEHIEAIHLDTNLKSVTLQNTEFLDNMTDGGGELTGFFKNNKIYRIYQSIGISYGVEVKEFYYWKQKLIYVREQFYTYAYDTSLNKFDYTKTETKFKGHFYFDRDKLIKQVISGQNNYARDSLDTGQVLLNESNQKLQLIRQKMSKSIK